jgi:hypothetical protein
MNMSRGDNKKKIQNVPKTVVKSQQVKLSEDMVYNLSHRKMKSKMPSISMIQRRKDLLLAITYAVF